MAVLGLILAFPARLGHRRRRVGRAGGRRRLRHARRRARASGAAAVESREVSARPRGVHRVRRRSRPSVSAMWADADRQNFPRWWLDRGAASPRRRRGASSRRADPAQRQHLRAGGCGARAVERELDGRAVDRARDAGRCCRDSRAAVALNGIAAAARLARAHGDNGRRDCRRSRSASRSISVRGLAGMDVAVCRVPRASRWPRARASRGRRSLGIAEARGGRRGPGNAIANTGLAAWAAVICAGHRRIPSSRGSPWSRRSSPRRAIPSRVKSARPGAGRRGSSRQVAARAARHVRARCRSKARSQASSRRVALAGLAVALGLIPIDVLAAWSSRRTTAGRSSESALGARFEAPGILDNDALNFVNSRDRRSALALDPGDRCGT